MPLLKVHMSQELLHPPGKLKSSREANETLGAPDLAERHPCPKGCALAAAVCCDSASISAGKTSSEGLSFRCGGEWSWIQLAPRGNGFELHPGRFRWVLGLKMVKFGG